jgi:hypothetical protein
MFSEEKTDLVDKFLDLLKEDLIFWDYDREAKIG